MNDQIEQRVTLSRLFDIYEPVLTEKQREAFRLHVLEDWTLSEVAERLEVSRQGAHDLVHRTRERLAEMEVLLGFSGKMRHGTGVSGNLKIGIGVIRHRYRNRPKPNFQLS